MARALAVLAVAGVGAFSPSWFWKEMQKTSVRRRPARDVGVVVVQGTQVSDPEDAEEDLSPKVPVPAPPSPPAGAAGVAGSAQAPRWFHFLRWDFVFSAIGFGGVDAQAKEMASWWAYWSKGGGLLGLTGTALVGDYWESVLQSAGWLVFAVVMASIGYCLRSSTQAIRFLVVEPFRWFFPGSPRAAVGEPAPARNAGPTRVELRGPNGDRPADNEFYGSIKNVDRRRGGRPHLLVSAGDQMARLEQPAGGAAARVSAHGVVLEYTNVLGASSRRARRQLERAPVKKVHLCRESPCPATLDVALHATLYGPLDPDAVFGFGDGWREHLKTAASCAGNCLRCTGTNTGRAGCCVGRCLGRSVGACCLRRRRREEPQVPKEWRRDDGLSETESEPDDVKCCAHQVFLEEPGMGPVPLARKACHERACWRTRLWR